MKCDLSESRVKNKRRHLKKYLHIKVVYKLYSRLMKLLDTFCFDILRCLPVKSPVLKHRASTVSEVPHVV